MSRTKAMTSLVLAFALVSTAPAEPKYPADKTAVAEHDAAVAKAKAVYVEALAAAETELAKKMDAAVNAAMDGHDLEAANEATAIKKDADAATAKLKDAGRRAPSPLAATDGKWHVRWAGGENHLSVTDAVCSNDTNSFTGSAKIENGVMILRWGSGHIDRITSVGADVLMLENWRPEDASRFPDNPTTYGRMDPEK